MEYWDQLGALGIELEGYEFNTSKEDMAMAAMARLQVKGSSSDRIDIKAAPDPASETLVKVPGEIELQLVGKARGWYKVKLLDGREGYIQQDNAKVLN